MPKLLGFDVSIEVEGKKLPEYKGEVDTTLAVPVATCWIPSEAGKEFKVVLAPPPAPRPSHWNFHLQFDGMDSISPRLSTLRKGYVCETRTLSEEYVSEGHARAFCFSTVELTDDESLVNLDSSRLGELRVHLSTVEEYVACGSYFGSTTEFTGRIHEKTKKGIAHCIKPSETRPVAAGSVSWVSSVGKKLAGTVIFKYRNMDILIAQEIAPGRRIPAPVADAPAGPSSNTNAQASSSTAPRPTTNTKPKKRKADDAKIEVDVEEEIRLREEEEELEARLAAVRAKQALNNPNKRIKTEVKSEGRPNFIPGEVIDLTL